MIDVVIFVVNIIPISYTIGVNGPMQYVFSERSFPFLDVLVGSNLAQRLHENEMLTPNWPTGGSLVGLTLPVTKHSLGDGKLLA